MKQTVIFAALLLVAGCSTTSTLTTPEPHPEKYALQIIRIEVPLPDTHTTLSSYTLISDDIEGLLKNPNAVITEFPVAYAAVGETGINDQTETLTFPGIDESKKVGCYAEMTIKRVENGYASCDLWFFEQAFQGMQQAGDVSKPVFKNREMKTEMALAPEVWFCMGGSTTEVTEDFSSGEKSPPKVKRMKEVLCVRILPPKE